MSLFDRLQQGFESSKSQLNSHLPQGTLARRLYAKVKPLVTARKLAPARVETRRPSAKRNLLIATALGLVFCAGQSHAQRPIGIDVSDYQSASINWNTLKNTYGITFGWAKSSEGLGSTGSGGGNWTTYTANAKAAGVPIGPYHFARYDTHPGTNGAVTEANFFWGVVSGNMKADGLTLMPMLDVEASFTGQTQSSMSQWVNAWCTSVSNSAYSSGLRLKPCLYISSSHSTTYFDSSVTGWNTDIADWPYAHASAAASAQNASAPPAGMTPWTSWQFWQYDDQNAAQAYTTGDGDIFHGTFSQLQATMLVTQVAPTITSQPASFSVPPGTNVNFTVSAVGTGGTLHYQWAFAGTNLSAATLSQYAIADAELTNAGGYRVVVTDNNGSVTSSAAFLSVVMPQTNQPNASTVAPVSIDNWWPAEGNGIDIYGGNTLTPQGGLIYGPGKIGTGFQFNGTSAYLSSGLSSVAPPWTATMWVNRASGAGTSARLLDDGGTYSLKLEQFSNTFQVGISKASGGDYTFPTPYTAPIGTWVHLTFVGTSSGTTLYVNGVSKGTLTNVFSLPRAYVGAGFVPSTSKFVDFMSGSLDEIMIFGRALGISEINSVYSSGTNGLVRAAILSSFSQPDVNQFQLNLKGETGKTLTIYSSTDLTNWVSMGTINNISGSTHFTDTNATNVQQYYRVKSP